MVPGATRPSGPLAVEPTTIEAAPSALRGVVQDARRGGAAGGEQVGVGAGGERLERAQGVAAEVRVHGSAPTRVGDRVVHVGRECDQRGAR